MYTAVDFSHSESNNVRCCKKGRESEIALRATSDSACVASDMSPICKKRRTQKNKINLQPIGNSF